MIKKIFSRMEYVPPFFIKKITGSFLWEGVPENKGMAITFDDGPDPEITPMILDILAEKSARGTFFLTGKNAEKNPEIVSEIARKGHVLGNHAFSHQRMFFMKKSVIKEEILRTQEVIFSSSKTKPVYFRPPYGSIGLPCARMVSNMGLETALWTVLAGDYGDFQREVVLSRIDPFIRPGAIMVFHDTLANGGYDLPAIIAEVCERAVDRNVSLVGLDEIIFEKDLNKEK